MYLLDTDILSNLMKRSPSSALVAKVARVPPEQQFTSSITLGELVYGAHRMRERTTILVEKIEAVLLPNLPVLAFDTAAARRYGEIRAELEGLGYPIGDADLRIAAIALSRALGWSPATNVTSGGYPSWRQRTGWRDRLSLASRRLTYRESRIRLRAKPSAEMLERFNALRRQRLRS